MFSYELAQRAEPTIPVVLQNGAKAITIELLLDSGAFTSLMSYEVGVLLGLKRRTLKEAEVDLIGFNNVLSKGVFRTVRVTVKGYKTVTLKAVWLYREQDRFIQPLLGRDFFQYFDIRFLKRGKIVIS